MNDIKPHIVTLAETPFLSLQGEGRNAGKPTHFIRVDVCNKKCSFCDTDFTSGRLEYDLANWFNTVYKNSRIKNIVVTGGEPLLKQPLIKYVLKNMDGRGRLTVETNGSIPIAKSFDSWARDVKVDCISVSPKSLKDAKLIGSRFHEDLYNIHFKVVYKIREFDKIISYLETLPNIRDYLWIMPMGATVEELDKSSKETAKYCIEKGFHMSGRSHITWKIK
jgi:organic radical activating enzyme